MSVTTEKTREVRTLAIQAVVETHRGLGIAERELKLGQFKRAGETISQATVMCELLDGLVPQIGRPTIIKGAPSDVVAALEALPDGAIVRCSPEAAADRECAVFVAVHAWGQRTWEGTGTHGTFATAYLANNCAPLTVIA